MFVNLKGKGLRKSWERIINGYVMWGLVGFMKCMGIYEGLYWVYIYHYMGLGGFRWVCEDFKELVIEKRFS